MYHQKPLLGQPFIPGHPLGPAGGFVCCLPMHESSGDKISDLSGNGNDGISTASWLAGDINFDGSTTINCGNSPNNSLLWEAGDSITLVFRVRPTVTGYSDFISRSSGTDRHFEFLMTDANIIRFHYRDSADNYHTYNTSAGLPSLNAWYTIAVTFKFGDGNSIKIYIDGVPVAGSWAASDGSGNPRSSNLNVHIGSKAGTGDYLTGQIKFVFVAKKYLTPLEITQLHIDPYCMFEKIPIWLMRVDAAAGGLSIPIAMHHYKMQGQ